MNIVDRRVDQLRVLDERIKNAASYIEALRVTDEKHKLEVELKGSLEEFNRLKRGWTFSLSKR